MACTGPTLFCCVGHDRTPRITAAVSSTNVLSCAWQKRHLSRSDTTSGYRNKYIKSKPEVRKYSTVFLIWTYLCNTYIWYMGTNSCKLQDILWCAVLKGSQRGVGVMEQQGVQFLSRRNMVKSGNGILCLFGFVWTLFTLLGDYQDPGLIHSFRRLPGSWTLFTLLGDYQDPGLYSLF